MTCQSPTPISFLAQVGQPGGEGRRKAPAILTPHHLGIRGTQGFWQQEWVSPDLQMSWSIQEWMLVTW